MNTNTESTAHVTARIKLTLHTKERFFVPGVCELLERIRETSSFQAASVGMEMSYSKAWKILNRAEREMGISLISRQSGGRKGGCSALTEAGERAACDYREMEAKLSETANELFKEYGTTFGR